MSKAPGPLVPSLQGLTFEDEHVLTSVATEVGRSELPYPERAEIYAFNQIADAYEYIVPFISSDPLRGLVYFVNCLRGPSQSCCALTKEERDQVIANITGYLSAVVTDGWKETIVSCTTRMLRTPTALPAVLKEIQTDFGHVEVHRTRVAHDTLRLLEAPPEV